MEKQPLLFEMLTRPDECVCTLKSTSFTVIIFMFVWSYTKWTASRLRISVNSEQLWCRRQDDIYVTPRCSHNESVALESQQFLRKTKVITAITLRMGNFDMQRLNDEDGTWVRLGTCDSFVWASSEKVPDVVRRAAAQSPEVASGQQLFNSAVVFQWNTHPVTFLWHGKRIR